MDAPAQQPSPPYSVIRRELEAGNVIPFLGAGVHLANRAPPGAKYGALANHDFLPSGSELAECLAQESEFPGGDAWERQNLSMMASYFVDNADRGLLRQNLRRVFAKPYAFHKDSDIHIHLAKNPKPLLVISTNYDDLLERALDEARKPYWLIVHPTDKADQKNSVMVWAPGQTHPEFRKPNEVVFKETDWVVYKMHGSVMRADGARADALIQAAPAAEGDAEELEQMTTEMKEGRLGYWDNYVISEEDYIEFLGRMTTDPVVPPAVSRLCRRRRMLFLGYGLRDWNLRVVLHTTRQLFPGQGEPNEVRQAEVLKSWAIQRSPSAPEQALWKNRKVGIYDVSIDTFVRRLWAPPTPPDPPAAGASA